MTISSKDAVFQIYPSVFSVMILALFLSFVPLPEINPSTLSANFRWRRDLINIYTHFRLKLGDRIYNSAVVGEQGWIYLSGDGNMADYQNTDPLNKRKLANLQVKLDQLNQELSQRGIALLVVVPPNKTTIYRHYMPDEIPILGTESRLEQFVKYMSINGQTTVLDLRPTLLKASQTQDIYYKTDTHWNSVGAFYAYEEIMKVLALKDPTLIPHTRSDYTYLHAGNFVHDLPLLMGLTDLKEENWVLIPKFDVRNEETIIDLSDGRVIRTVTNENKTLPKLLVFGDSFYGSSLAQFMEPHFGEVKEIPFTYEPGIWSLDWISKENPDIVIIEIVERYLDISLPLLLEN